MAEQLSLLDPIEIFLTKGYVALVDPIDADLARLKWHFSDRGTSFCAARREFNNDAPHGKLVKMHRIVLERKLGRPLFPNEICDHVDGNSLNNCRSNLRIATRYQNMWNSKKPRTNKSGYKGVYFNKVLKRWQAYIKVNNRQVYLGLYDTAEEGHRAYCAAAVRLRGEFARFE